MKNFPNDSDFSPAEHVTGEWDERLAGRKAQTGEIFGSYELIAEVARGGMGVVYRARQKGLERTVALKMVLAASLGNATAIARFLQEARSAASLDHPNVVPIYDAGEVEGRVYYTMAYIDGPDLRHYVDKGGLPPLATALRLFVQIVAGVAHAHQNGIIHRDLKPANVLIDRDGRARVTDFGLAKRSASDSHLTGTGQMMGTPAYMAPEQAREANEVSPAADVYALGGILYFLLTTRPPFGGESGIDLILKVISEPPPMPREFNATIPPEIEAICMRCLAKDPSVRYRDATLLLEELTDVMDAILPKVTRKSGVLSPLTPRSVDPTPTPSFVAEVTPSTHRSKGTISLTPAPSEVPPPTKSKRAMLLLVGVGLIALVVMLGIIRPWQKSTAVTETVPTVRSGDLWPIPSQGDFPLTVEILTRADRQADGVHRVKNDSPLEIRLLADQTCKVAIFTISPNGDVVHLFPNERDNDPQLTAGRELRIPTNNRYTINAEPTEGVGVERLRVIAATKDLPAIMTKARQGGFKPLPAKEREELILTLRSFTLRPKDSNNLKIAEAEVLYRVEGTKP